MEEFKDYRDLLKNDMEEINLEEVSAQLGFVVICNKCDERKNIVYSVSELTDGEDIDITSRYISCTNCGNKIGSCDY